MRFYLSICFLFFSCSAAAETLFLCSEYGAEGLRTGALEAWIEQPDKMLQPNTCELTLSQVLKEDFAKQKIWAPSNVASVFKHKLPIERAKKDWFMAHEVELVALANSFAPDVQSVLSCTLRPLQVGKSRDFRSEYLYQARCRRTFIGNDRDSCVVRWQSRAVTETHDAKPDPVIAQVIENGRQALAKCFKEK